MKHLSREQMKALHTQLIAATGGTDGIRDEGLLDSALAAPFQTFGDQDVYPSIEDKAARFGYGLVRNHAFLDGNKRIGAHAMLVFLALNGIVLDYTQKELSDTFLKTAAGDFSQEELLAWIREHHGTEHL